MREAAEEEEEEEEDASAVTLVLALVLAALAVLLFRLDLGEGDLAAAAATADGDFFPVSGEGEVGRSGETGIDLGRRLEDDDDVFLDAFFLADATALGEGADGVGGTVCVGVGNSTGAALSTLEWNERLPSEQRSTHTMISSTETGVIPNRASVESI